jgi:hypothetical protein
MALRTHYHPSGRLKNDFAEVDDAMFHGVKCQYKFVLYILEFEKSDLDKVH